MKVYVVTDMEGVGCIYSRGQLDRNGSEIMTARLLLTEEVNALAEGLIEGGAKEIVVLDGHAGGDNLLLDKLHPEAKWVLSKGHQTPMSDLDKSYDAMLLLGQHAMAGTQDGILNHTYMSGEIFNFTINGKKYGEIGVAAMIAGYYNVPVVFCSGDLAAVREAKELVGDIEGVIVKEGYSMYKGKFLSHEKCRQLIREGAKRALLKLGKVKPYVLKPPLELKMEFMRSDFADKSADIEGNIRVDSRTLSRTVQSVLDVLTIYH